MWSSYFRFWRPLPPPPHKISCNILIYLTSYRILGAPPPLSLSLKSLNIVRGVWEGGGEWLNPTKDNGAALSVIKIVKYCGVGGGGGTLGGGAPKSYKR